MSCLMALTIAPARAEDVLLTAYANTVNPWMPGGNVQVSLDSAATYENAWRDCSIGRS